MVTGRLRRGRWDRALAAGADPTTRRALAARAARLTSRSRRDALAAALERLVAELDAPPSLARVSPRGHAVRANARELWSLARELRDPHPVYARGVAMLGLLLRDGTGPLYLDVPGRTLAAALSAIRAALAGAEAPAAPEPPAGLDRQRRHRRVARHGREV